MISDDFIAKLFKTGADAKGISIDEFRKQMSEQMDILNRKLEQQSLSQKMTPEVLAKRCTL